MLLDICKELLNDVHNGWEYRELETEEHTEDGGYILETLKYELGATVYWRMALAPDGEHWEGGSIICNTKEELLSCTPEILENFCNGSWYYNGCQVEESPLTEEWEDVEDEPQNAPCDTYGVCSGTSCPYYFSVCNK